MKSAKIKKKLIDEIKLSDNAGLLKELYHFLNLENEIETYKLNDDQRSAVAETRSQLKNGDFLTNEDANNEIDKWLEE